VTELVESTRTPSRSKRIAEQLSDRIAEFKDLPSQHYTGPLFFVEEKLLTAKVAKEHKDREGKAFLRVLGDVLASFAVKILFYR
jgi:hypothetical protein